MNSLYGIEVVSMAHSHIMYLTFKYFMQSIEQSVSKCPHIKENLLNLAKLYALSEIHNDSSALYETGYFTMGTGPILLDAMKHMMSLIRPQLIPLVESFEYSDNVLISAIGNSYGDIYE